MQLKMKSLRRFTAGWSTVDNAVLTITLLAFAVGCGTLFALDAVGGDVAATTTVPAPVEALYYFPARFPAPSGELELLPPTF